MNRVKGFIDAKSLTPEEDVTKYAYAEVVEDGSAYTMAVPVEGPRSILDSLDHIQKQSQALTDKRRTLQKWVEPRIPLDVMASVLDMNIWHKRCVFLKAALMCGLGYELVTDHEDKEPDADYERIMDFLENPNERPQDTFTRIAFRSAVDYVAFGNFYQEASMTPAGPVGKLYHRRAVTMRRDVDPYNGGYWQVLGTKSVQFDAWGQRTPGRNKILHHYVYDPLDDYGGTPDWSAGLADMYLDRSSVEFLINLFKNQLVAKFAVIIEGGKLSNEGRASLRQFIQTNATGVTNAGRTIILDTDDPNVKIKIEKLEMDFGDKQGFMGKVRDSARDNTIAAHGTPPRMLGIMSAGQLGGTGEMQGQLKSYAENEIRPQQSMVNDFYNRTLIASFGSHKWRLKFNEMDVTDPKLDAEVEEILGRAGLKLPTESRETLGLAALSEEELAERLAAAKAGGDFTGLSKRLSQIRKILDR